MAMDLLPTVTSWLTPCVRGTRLTEPEYVRDISNALCVRHVSLSLDIFMISHRAAACATSTGGISTASLTLFADHSLCTLTTHAAHSSLTLHTHHSLRTSLTLHTHHTLCSPCMQVTPEYSTKWNVSYHKFYKIVTNIQQ
jgi:hypothetical protein